jgi:hypothetical protein
MKKFFKFIFGGIAAILIAAFATFNVSLNSQNDLSAIYSANVEALSSGEGGKPGDKCYAGSFANVPEGRYCLSHCAEFQNVNTNIQTCN